MRWRPEAQHAVRSVKMPSTSPVPVKSYRGLESGQGPNFGDNTAQKTIGNSSFNALETNLRFSGKRSNFLLGYTYSKSIDQGSNIGEQMNPFNSGLSRALSSSI